MPLALTSSVALQQPGEGCMYYFTYCDVCAFNLWHYSKFTFANPETNKHPPGKVENLHPRSAQNCFWG